MKQITDIEQLKGKTIADAKEVEYKYQTIELLTLKFTDNTFAVVDGNGGTYGDDSASFIKEELDKEMLQIAKKAFE